jgi:hypothetical protein
MPDHVLNAFLSRQRDEGLALSAASDLVTVFPANDKGDRYLVRFSCTGLVRRNPSAIVEANEFVIYIWFPSDYLRTADPFRVLTWLSPRNVWHPNISDEVPRICVGRLAPGTSLVDILYQVFEIITWNRVTMREDDALNRAACEWARQHRDRLPLDHRPLKRVAAVPHVIDVSAPRRADGQAL